MKDSEILHVIIAIIVLSIVISFNDVIALNFARVGFLILFAFLIISTNILGKKIMASRLDADVEHSIWKASRYGLQYHWHLRKPIPAGILFPLVITAFSLGFFKFMSILEYETKALKRRAARRYGYYSYTEMTDWHNALVGAGGILATLLLAFITYWIPVLQGLPALATYYAFWNMIPIFKFDGAQIFFGSRPLWTFLALLTLIFLAYALLLI